MHLSVTVSNLPASSDTNKKLSYRRGTARPAVPNKPAFGVPVGVTPVEFRRDLWRQKTTAPGLSCGFLCVILRDRQTQTDRQTDTGPQHIPR